jgi:hypothetical protein
MGVFHEPPGTDGQFISAALDSDYQKFSCQSNLKLVLRSYMELTMAVNSALNKSSPYAASQGQVGEGLPPRMMKTLAPVLSRRSTICCMVTSRRSSAKDII